MSTPFVLTLRTNLYQQGGGVKKIEGAIETRTCGTFYAGKRKQGLFTLKEYGARMMQGQRDARWFDTELEGAEDCRAVAGFPLLDDHASGEFWRLY